MAKCKNCPGLLVGPRHFRENPGHEPVVGAASPGGRKIRENQINEPWMFNRRGSDKQDDEPLEDYEAVTSSEPGEGNNTWLWVAGGIAGAVVLLIIGIISGGKKPQEAQETYQTIRTNSGVYRIPTVQTQQRRS